MSTVKKKYEISDNAKYRVEGRTPKGVSIRYFDQIEEALDHVETFNDSALYIADRDSWRLSRIWDGDSYEILDKPKLAKNSRESRAIKATYSRSKYSGFGCQDPQQGYNVSLVGIGDVLSRISLREAQIVTAELNAAETETAQREILAKFRKEYVDDKPKLSKNAASKSRDVKNALEKLAATAASRADKLVETFLETGDYGLRVKAVAIIDRAADKATATLDSSYTRQQIHEAFTAERRAVLSHFDAAEEIRRENNEKKLAILIQDAREERRKYLRKIGA